MSEIFNIENVTSKSSITIFHLSLKKFDFNFAKKFRGFLALLIYVCTK